MLFRSIEGFKVQKEGRNLIRGKEVLDNNEAVLLPLIKVVRLVAHDEIDSKVNNGVVSLAPVKPRRPQAVR